MDTTRFDRIATLFAETQTRRGTFRYLAAAAGAVGLGVLGSGAVDAKKKGRKKGGRRRGGHGGATTTPPTTPTTPTDPSTPDKPFDMCPVAAKTNAPECGTDPGKGACDCHKAVEGNNICVGWIDSCDALVPCTTTKDCRESVGFHFYCQAADGGGCGQVCVPECGNTNPF